MISGASEKELDIANDRINLLREIQELNNSLSNSQKLVNRLLIEIRDLKKNCSQLQIENMFLRNHLEQATIFIKMVKEESYQSSVIGICDVALGELTIKK